MKVPTLKVTCLNPACEYYERVREVSYGIVENGLFSKPSVYCVCNPYAEMWTAGNGWYNTKTGVSS